LPLNGGTLTGPLTLVSNPTASAHAASKQYVDTQISTLLPLSGGVLAGGLTLATSPTTNLGAATKQYVDTSTGGRGAINVKAPPYNAQLNGVADDTAAFKAAYVAAAAGSTIFVPNGVAVLQNPDSWGVPLTKRVRWIVDGTTLPDGTSLAAASPTGNGAASLSLPGLVIGNSKVANETSIGHSQSSDFAVNHSSYVVAHGDGTAMQIATNHRVDTVIYNSPGNFIWAGFDRMIWAGTQTPNAARPAEHVGRYIQTVRQEVGTSSSGGAAPATLAMGGLSGIS